MDITTFSKTLAGFNKSGVYQETLDYFESHKSLFTVEEISSHAYVPMSILRAGVESGQDLYLLDFFEHYHPCLDIKWFSYFLYRLKRQAQMNWLLIFKYCSLFKVEELSTDCRNIVIDGRRGLATTELASDREQWYATMSKVLLILGRYEQCIRCCEEGIARVERMHYSNHTWLIRRIALSELALGHRERALEKLKKIERKKSEWFIQSEISKVYYELGQYEEAFLWGLKGLLSYGPMSYKVGLLVLVGDILCSQDDLERGCMHYQMAAKVRKEQGWGIPKDLEEALARCSTVDRGLELESKLRAYWESRRLEIKKIESTRRK